MYCRVLACDFDGTTADSGALAPTVIEALRSARSRGFTTLLVTGRVFTDLRPADVAPFDAIVAENGAVVRLPEPPRTIRLGAPPPKAFLAALAAARVPFHVGEVVVGTDARHAARVLELIRESGIDAQIVFNRSAVMVLPSGVNKAAGVQQALRETGRSARNVIAFGDAENDLPLLGAAEVAVAPSGALQTVVAASDVHLTEAGSSGVAQFIERVVAAQGIIPTPPRQHFVLGQDDSGAPVTLPSSGMNLLLVSGDPHAGKSWLAGLVAERLLDRGYRVCIVDPEGDHLAFAPLPGIMVAGDDIRLPAPHTVVRILRDEPASLVLVLSSLSLPDKQLYVERLLAELTEFRAETGLPHWIVVDEAHYFLSDGAPATRYVESRTGDVLLATYRPSLLARSVLALVGAHLLTETVVE